MSQKTRAEIDKVIDEWAEKANKNKWAVKDLSKQLGPYPLVDSCHEIEKSAVIEQQWVRLAPGNCLSVVGVAGMMRTGLV